jgi:hypothetical protein
MANFENGETRDHVLSSFQRHFYSAGGTLPSLIALLIRSKGLPEIANLSDKGNGLSYLILGLAVCMFIFGIHLVTTIKLSSGRAYATASAASFSSLVGIAFSVEIG